MESRAVMGVHYETTHAVVADAVKTLREPAVRLAASKASRHVVPSPPAAAPPKPRHTRTLSCVKVAARFRYTSEPNG